MHRYKLGEQGMQGMQGMQGELLSIAKQKSRNPPLQTQHVNCPVDPWDCASGFRVVCRDGVRVGSGLVGFPPEE